MNQFEEYTPEQIEFIKENLNSNAIRFSKGSKLEIEKKFKKQFGFHRGFNALKVKANRLNIRPTFKRAIVGVSTKASKKGCSINIYCNDNPPTYMPKSRYVWEQYYKEKLNKSDVIRFVDGDVTNFDIDNLQKLSRAENVRANKLSSKIPIDTRILIAKVEMVSANLTGRGDYSNAELEWIKVHTPKRKASHEEWCELAKKFNKKFNKNRTNRDLIMVGRRK